jgi:hypothetical protein
MENSPLYAFPFRPYRYLFLPSALDQAGHLPVGLYLRFKTIAIFIKNEIHTAMFIA